MTKKSLKPKYAAMLLFTLTVGIYYSSLLNVGILSLDDSQFMHRLSNETLTLRQVLSPGWDGKYYRPVVGFSFLADQMLYGDDPFGFRFTNVIIHAFNVILVFFVSRALLRHIGHRNENNPPSPLAGEKRLFLGGFSVEKVSFFAALLFAVHPITVESVSWISGRADPLALFWSLLATLFYLMFKERGRYPYLLFSILSMALAVLSKETALATPIVIAAFELFYCRNFGYERGRYSLPLFALLTLTVPLYLRLRSGVIFTEDVSLRTFWEKLSPGSLASNLETIIASFGFYLKKFLFPFPLNFAIHEINLTAYFFLGLTSLLAFCILALYKKVRVYNFFLFWALIGLAPASLLSITDIAWTRWGERYIYISAAPLSIVCMIVISSFAESSGRQKMLKTYLLISLIILGFSVATFQRSIMMNDNEKIFGDTYRKSPAFISAAVAYANALAQKGKMAEAETILLKAEKLPDPKHTLLFTLGHIYRHKGDYDRAEICYNKALEEARKDKRLVTVGPGFRNDILTAIGDIEIQRAEGLTDEDDKKIHYLRAIETFKRATDESMEAFLFYRIALIYQIIGDDGNAARYFREFIKRWRDDHYKDNAITMLGKLEK